MATGSFKRKFSALSAMLETHVRRFYDVVEPTG
jgi:hypothetical protein